MNASANRPRVSVIMPVYNAERYVVRAIKSILDQSFPDFELLACDDGSTDDSLRLARELAASDARVRVLAREHGGIGAVRDHGVCEARGEWLANLDADDVALSGRLAEQVAYMEAHADCVVLGTQSRFIDEDGDLLGQSDQPLSHDAIEQDLWRGLGTAVTHSTAIMRREAVVQAGGYRHDLQISEDLDLYLRLLDHGTFANLPTELNLVTRHCRSVSAIGNRVEQANSREAIVHAARRRRHEPESLAIVAYPPHPDSRAEWHAKWAFRALRNGYPGSARKHALRALRHGPFSLWGWRAAIRILPVTRG